MIGPTRLAWAAAATSIVLWAAAFPAIRVAVADYHPTTLTALRLVVASFVLAAAAPALRMSLPRPRDLPLLALCGVLGMAGYQLLLNWGERTTSAATASLIVAVSPAYSVLLAALLLKERLTRPRVVGIAVAFTGAALIAFGHGDTLRIEQGALLVLGAALAYGTYHVAHRPLLSRYRGAVVVCYATWLAGLLTTPVLASVPRAVVRAAPEATAAAVFLGIGPSAVAFVTWAYAVHRLGVTPAATSLYLTPAIALPIAALWLGEVPQPLELAGGAVALIGVAIASRRPPDPAQRSAGRFGSDAAVERL